MVTTTTELIETGEQRDSRGRKRMPAQRREELVRAWRASGLTQAQFARREGVSSTASIEVRLVDGVVVRGDDVQKLSALVRTLRG